MTTVTMTTDAGNKIGVTATPFILIYADYCRSMIKNEAVPISYDAFKTLCETSTNR